jgi:hypothetical protein
MFSYSLENRGLLHNHQLAERRELFVWKEIDSLDGIEAASNSIAIPPAQLHNLLQASLEKDLTEAEIFNLLPAGNWIEPETLSLLSEALHWYKFVNARASVSDKLQYGDDKHWKEVTHYFKQALSSCLGKKYDDTGANLLLALQIHQHLRINEGLGCEEIPFILQNKQHLMHLLRDPKFDLALHATPNPQLAKFIADLQAAGFDLPKAREEFQTVWPGIAGVDEGEVLAA